MSGPDLGTVVLVEAQGEPYSAVELALSRTRLALGRDRGAAGDEERGEPEGQGRGIPLPLYLVPDAGR